MGAGLSGKFNILQRSPHDDHENPRTCLSAQSSKPDSKRWVPSRYTVRANTDDGRLVLWNTYSGSISLIKPEQKPVVLPFLKKQGVEAKNDDGMVEFLQDRGFIVQEGTNEYRKFELDFGRQHYRTNILELILLASEDCNFRCQYCYESFERGTMKPAVREGVKNLVRRRVEEGIDVLSVSWFGGEPLYGFPAIEDLGPFFIEMRENHGLKFMSSMTTNGYLLTPDVADKLLAWQVKSFQITIDGIAETHDVSRPTREGQGTFHTIFNNLVKLSRRDDDFRVRLRVNFDRRNHDRIPELVSLLKEELKGDERFRMAFHPVGQWGGANDDMLDVCGKKESREIIAQLEHIAALNGFDVKGSIKTVNRFGSEVCYAARPYNFIVGAEGQLMKCTVLLDQKDYNVVGNLTQSGDLVLDDAKLGVWTEPAFQHDTKCQKCVVLPNCQGIHCPLVRIEDDKSPCCSMRSTFKSRLLSAVEKQGSKTRKVNVQSAVRGTAR